MTSADFQRHIRAHYPASQLEPISAEAEAQLRVRYPWLPDDYFAYLREVGWGQIGESQYMVYSSPLEPSEVFDPRTAKDLKGIVLVGDDFGEACEAYANRNGRSQFGTVSKEDGTFAAHSEATLFAFLISWFGKA